jgi:hypothetical protein
MSANCVTPIAVLRSMVDDRTLDLACRILLEDHVSAPQITIGFYLLIFTLTC